LDLTTPNILSCKAADHVRLAEPPEMLETIKEILR